MFLEEYPDKKIHVFDSGSAGPGESLTVYKIGELIRKDLSFEEIVEQVEDFIKNMKTFFVLDSVENLVANGRISKTKAFIVNALNIKPVLYAKDGVIEIYEKVRGRLLCRAYAVFPAARPVSHGYFPGYQRAPIRTAYAAWERKWRRRRSAATVSRGHAVQS